MKHHQSSLNAILRVIATAISHYLRHHHFVRAAALAYTSLLAFIPTLILVHAIAGALGLFHAASDFLPLLNEQMQLGLPMEQIQPLIRQAQNIGLGQLGLIGSSGLLITFMAAMETLETNMNVVWRVRKNRSLWRKAIIAIPFLIIVGLALVGVSGFFSFLRAWMDNVLREYTSANLIQIPLQWGFFYVAFHALVLSCLFLLYKLVPNTRVNTLYALISATLTTLLIQLFIRISFNIQTLFFQRMSLFYGSLAFVPLIMLLTYCVWCLVLLGNALTWSQQKFFHSHEPVQSYGGRP